jgi:hypothetical protein
MFVGYTSLRASSGRRIRCASWQSMQLGALLSRPCRSNRPCRLDRNSAISPLGSPNGRIRLGSAWQDAQSSTVWIFVGFPMNRPACAAGSVSARGLPPWQS